MTSSFEVNLMPNPDIATRDAKVRIISEHGVREEPPDWSIAYKGKIEGKNQNINK